MQCSMPFEITGKHSNVLYSKNEMKDNEIRKHLHFLNVILPYEIVCQGIIAIDMSNSKQSDSTNIKTVQQIVWCTMK